MNYFTRGVFSDPKFWWKIIVIPAIGGLVLMDFLSSMFASPGFFNLWIVKIVGTLSIIGVIGYGVFLYAKPKSDKKIEEDQAFVEKMNEERFRKIIQENPHFQTLCYQCLHFDQNHRACGKKVINERALKARLSETFTYCLHWIPLADDEEQNQI